MRPQTHTSDDVNKQAMAMGSQLMMRAAAGQQVCPGLHRSHNRPGPASHDGIPESCRASHYPVQLWRPVDGWVNLACLWSCPVEHSFGMRPLRGRLQMKLASKPGAAQPAAATVTLDTFLHNFSVPKLMDKIADLEQHNLRAKIAAMSRPQNQQPGQQQKSASAVAFIQDLQLVDKLLISFQRHASPRLSFPPSAMLATPLSETPVSRL